MAIDHKRFNHMTYNDVSWHDYLRSVPLPCGQYLAILLIHRRKSICSTWEMLGKCFLYLSIHYLSFSTLWFLTSAERGQVSTDSTAVAIFRCLKQAPTRNNPISESFHRKCAKMCLVTDLKTSIIQNLLQIFDRTWHSLWSTIMPFLWNHLQARWWWDFLFLQEPLQAHLMLVLSAKKIPPKKICSSFSFSAPFSFSHQIFIFSKKFCVLWCFAHFTRGVHPLKGPVC